MNKSDIPSVRFLAESHSLKVYSSHENVYLKIKGKHGDENEFNKNDKLIASHYGDPYDAIIFPSGKYVVVSGCGLTIYNVEKRVEKQIMDESNNTVWTNGLHQDQMDDQDVEFRFVRFNKNNKLRIIQDECRILRTRGDVKRNR